MKTQREAELLQRVVIGDLGLVEVAKIMGYTTRTAYRRIKRFRQQGMDGLVHRLVGRRSNRAKDPAVREHVVSLYRSFGKGMSLSAVVDKIRQEEGIALCRESLRRWLMEAGIWQPSPKARGIRRAAAVETGKNA